MEDAAGGFAGASAECPRDRPSDLAALYAAVASCGRCGLAATRVNPVPGAGNPQARIMFIGEAPGKNEDLQGQPFVGSAGKLLNELLASAGLEREDVYIANILKCRPPKNRNPKRDEIAACTPWLAAQLALVEPELIVTLGNFATRFVLGTQEGITQLRGTIYKQGAYHVLPMFHPAATIYDRSKRAILEGDFQLLAQYLRP